MKRIFTLFLLVCAMACMPYYLMAGESNVTVTVHFLYPSSWSTVKAYAYFGSGNSATKLLGDWGGTEATATTSDDWTAKKETLNGVSIASWKITVPQDKLSDTKVIFNDGGSNQYPASGQDGFAVEDNGYYNTTGLDKTFDIAYEVVATLDGKTVILPMTASRKRNSTEYDYQKWTVGFKDEALPGVKDSEVKVYVRGKNKPNVQFRPTNDNSTFGNNCSYLSSVTNTSMTGYYNEAYTTENSSNCFVIKKGSGVSYTIGLNTGAKVDRSVNQSNNNISYAIAANSVSLYVNKSIDALYCGMYNASGTGYKNTSTVSKKADLEDYYMLGYVNDANTYQSTKSTALKMSKRIYLNPIDNSVVDSIVYSGIVKKSANQSSTYKNLYFSFLPASVFDDTNRNATPESSYASNSIWNYVVRPQLQDEYDASALSGAVAVSGCISSGDNMVCNGEQSLNPLVDDSYNYYVIHLNTTTSTYRIELVKDVDVVIPQSGIRTFCSPLNLKLPEGYKAYAAHDFEASKENTSYNGQSNGTVKLRSLKYIPESEPVVLIYSNTLTEAITQHFEVLTSADETVTLTDTPEEWWSKNYSDETYANYLVASLYGLTIENGTYVMTEDGKYDYKTRHFALNQFSKTKYYKEHYADATDKPADYWGFFRAAGNVKAGYAYLCLPADKLDFNGQITDNVKENTDDANAQSKVTLSFDINPWSDSTTGISELQNSVRNDDAYYTLQGIKVTHPTNGIYIYKGKKVKK